MLIFKYILTVATTVEIERSLNHAYLLLESAVSALRQSGVDQNIYAQASRAVADAQRYGKVPVQHERKAYAQVGGSIK